MAASRVIETGFDAPVALPLSFGLVRRRPLRVYFEPSPGAPADAAKFSGDGIVGRLFVTNRRFFGAPRTTASMPSRLGSSTCALVKSRG